MPTGVLMKIHDVNGVVWQGRRPKDRTPAEADQLMIVPPTDFGDQRASELLQVERNSCLVYKQMAAAALADQFHLAKTSAGELSDGKYFKTFFFHSREYQEELRRKSPHAGSAD